MRPLVISHAACAGHAPENTLAGIRKAIELGSDGIEVDVQMSADGVPVLMHDLTVDRTTSGAGAIADLTLAELRNFDIGGEPIPTLAEVLDLTKGNVLLVMEIKSPGIEMQVAKVVRHAGALDDVMTWSFYPKALEGMRSVEPRIPAALLIAPESLSAWPSMREHALLIGVQGVSVFFLGITEAIAESCRRSGLALYSWTADQESQMQTLVGLGVDGICTNFPDRAVRVLRGE